jgi:hypothetical protein
MMLELPDHARVQILLHPVADTMAPLSLVDASESVRAPRRGRVLKLGGGVGLLIVAFVAGQHVVVHPHPGGVAPALAQGPIAPTDALPPAFQRQLQLPPTVTPPPGTQPPSAQPPGRNPFGLED